MNKPKIKRLVIVGGGTAGWMTAAAMAKLLGAENYDISLVESADIGTVGVGEATIPPIQTFNQLLELDENEFIRETNATFKVGIEFKNWHQVGQRYFHPFGLFGYDMDHVQFSNYWVRFARLSGNLDFGRFNLETLAARAGKFGKTTDTSSLAPRLNYAFQFDASQYAAYLRKYSETRGLKRIEAKVSEIVHDANGGHVSCLKLEDGRLVHGDLFIDCTGFRALLIGSFPEATFEDWSAYLPCNRAVAVPCEKADTPLSPFTTSTALEAGWQWRIPLQHRTGNGHVFCSDYISEDEATARLLGNLDGRVLKDPISLRFCAGFRRKQWHKNVVAIGLASGFLEPLESTSIHLIQSAITKLLGYFPKDEISKVVCDRFNAEMTMLYEGTRDFLIAHYHLTEREDTPFWKRTKYMQVPESLKEKLEWFRQTSIVPEYGWELFKQSSWFAVLVGQGLYPDSYHPIADAISNDELKLRMSRIRSLVQDRLSSMPSHDQYIATNCRSIKV